MSFNELALFAGSGGGILGGELLGWRTVCAVEFDPYARRVLLARQRDGALPRFPIWDDVRTFDGKPWRGHVNVISGGFPCQDISAAGKGAGLAGARSGLWSEMARIVREVRPGHVFVENSPVLTSRGLCRVLGDLAALGYNARWGVLGAHHVGAPHKRDRIWIVASDADGERGWAQQIGEPGSEDQTELRDDGPPELVANPAGFYAQRFDNRQRERKPWRGGWWETEPELGRVADGVANRVDRLRAIGNGQVPAVAALAWQMLSEGHQ